MRKNIQEKGFDFSIRIAELVRFLRTDKLGFPLCERLLSCGVGAGLACRKAVSECRSSAEYAGQAAEFVTEADYIIDMARVAGYLTAEQCVHIQEDCKKLKELLAEPDNYDEKRNEK